ncbi:MAG: chemotaxis protein CheW [Paracoccaceae bacterium]|nr:chemotaxis protein CheW [Paracoccaceae bacterium]
MDTITQDAPQDGKDRNEEVELLSFRIGEHEYSVDIMSVREIRGWTRATSLPRSPHYVHGVINLRGTVLPVVDLARRLGLEAEEPSERSVIIVVDLEGRTVGVRVDAVSDILSIPRGEMQPPPEMLNDDTERFVRGLIVIEDRMVRVLHLEAVLPPGTEAAA